MSATNKNKRGVTLAYFLLYAYYNFVYASFLSLLIRC